MHAGPGTGADVQQPALPPWWAQNQSNVRWYRATINAPVNRIAAAELAVEALQILGLRRVGRAGNGGLGVLQKRINDEPAG